MGNLSQINPNGYFIIDWLYSLFMTTISFHGGHFRPLVFWPDDPHWRRRTISGSKRCRTVARSSYSGDAQARRLLLSVRYVDGTKIDCRFVAICTHLLSCNVIWSLPVVWIFSWQLSYTDCCAWIGNIYLYILASASMDNSYPLLQIELWRGRIKHVIPKFPKQYKSMN
jgi:hypothetical protein